MNKVKIGLVCIGLDTYWKQFDGLLDRLLSGNDIIKEKLVKYGAEVVDVGMIDTPLKASLAVDMLHGVELLFVNISTYALSSTVLPIAKGIKSRVILLNLQPSAAMNYNYINSLDDRGKMTGEWLANCQACSLPEIASVFRRTGVDFSIITGHMEQKEVWSEIKEWVTAANAVYGMRHNNLAVLGHYYCGMLDVYTDLTRQCGVFGTHIELVEMCELKKLRDGVNQNDVKAKIAQFEDEFTVDSRCSKHELIRAAKTSVALDKLVEKHNIGSMAYYYEGEDDYQDIVTSIIAGNTLLTSKGIPVAGECEVKNAQAMKIFSLMGAGGSFSEFYGLDFNDDVVMLGHDGPAHISIAQGNVELVPLPIYHGKPGSGLSIQMSVKHGDVTILSVCEDAQDIYLLVAEGKSVEGPVLNIGNTNSRYKFPIGAKEFINAWSEAGPSHHCAIGIGHLGTTIEKFGSLLGIKTIKIC